MLTNCCHRTYRQQRSCSRLGNTEQRQASTDAYRLWPPVSTLTGTGPPQADTTLSAAYSVSCLRHVVSRSNPLQPVTSSATHTASALRVPCCLCVARLCLHCFAPLPDFCVARVLLCVACIDCTSAAAYISMDWPWATPCHAHYQSAGQSSSARLGSYAMRQ